MTRFIMVVIALLAVGLWAGCDDDATTTTQPVADTTLLARQAPAGLVQVELGIRAAVHVEAEAGECSNNPGPYITLTGEIALGGVDARLIFRNADKGPHERTEDVEASVVLLPEGETIRFSKAPPRGGAGGNPWIYLVFTDEDGNDYGEPMLLGRCVQGLDVVDVALALPAFARAQVTTGACSNSPGPEIELTGELVIGGLNGKLVFTNNAKFTHVHEEDVVVDLVILPAGESIEFAKQPPLGGVGGNPKIWLQFTDGDGGAMSDELYLGRCVQLGR